SEKLRYINASHVPAVWLPKDTAKLNWNSLDILLQGISPALGMSDYNCTIGESRIHHGWRLALLTDGLLERRDSNGKSISESAFYKMLIETHTANIRTQADFLDQLLDKSDELAKQA